MKGKGKGEVGYFSSERRRRCILSFILLLVPLAVIVAGLLIFKGEKNLLTVIGLVLTIPFAMQLTTTIPVFLHKSVDDETAEKLKAHEGSLMMAYELYVTNEKGSTMVDAFAICGGTVVGLVTEKTDNLAFTKEYIEKTMRANGISATVQFLRELPAFLERMDSMNAHASSLREGNAAFKPDQRYPDYGKEQMIWHLLTRLSL